MILVYNFKMTMKETKVYNLIKFVVTYVNAISDIKYYNYSQNYYHYYYIFIIIILYLSSYFINIKILCISFYFYTKFIKNLYILWFIVTDFMFH